MYERAEPQIRIVHITTVPQSLFFLRGQAGFLRKSGFEVHAISSPGPELEVFAREEEVAVHAVPMPRAITPADDLASLAQLTRLLRRLKPDLVHAHTPKGGLLGMAAARLASVPARIYNVHGLPFVTATGARRTLLRTTERASCAMANSVLCVSRSMLEICVEERICAREKLRVLCQGSINGVDATARFNPERFPKAREERRARLGIPLDAKVIGFVGRLVRDKGIVELEQAFRGLRETFPDAHLILVGEAEAKDPLPRETLERLRAGRNVHLVGHDWDIAPWFAAMDVLALPTYREGFVVVALEAAAMGLPIVGTNVPGCRDAIEDGVTGTLVAAQDADGLRQAMARYLASPELARAHGVAGRARALRDYRPEQIWAAQRDLYLTLVESTPRGQLGKVSRRIEEASGQSDEASARGDEASARDN